MSRSLLLLALVAMMFAAVAVNGETYDPTVWLGDYSSTGCSQTSCCCMTSVSIAQSASGYTVAGPLAGQCGGMTYKSYPFSTPTSNTVTYVAEGQTHTATRNPTSGTINDVNAQSTSCNGVLTKSGGGGGESPVMTVAAFEDSSCKKQLGSATVTKGACIADSGDYAVGSCSGDTWTVKGFRTSSTCSGTPDAQASGTGKSACVPFAEGFIRVACDGSSISPAAVHSASAFVVMALAAIAAIAVRA